MQPNVYCGYANYAEARWWGKCGSENPYCRKPYSPKNHFFTPPRAAARGTEAWVVAPGLGATGSKREATELTTTIYLNSIILITLT